jgi:drug/metabolite transporter (DMT)-like permease
MTSTRQTYLIGCAMVLGAGIVWSAGVVFVRLAASSDAWQYMFWRSIAFAAGLAILVRANDTRSIATRLKALTPMSLVGALMMTATATFFVAAVKATSVANTFIILATAPLATALLARLVLGEKLTWPTVIAIAVAICGFIVMAGGGVGSFGSYGDLFAAGAMLTFAIYVVCARGATKDDLLPMLLAAALMTIAVTGSATLLQGRTLLVPVNDIACAFAHGGAVLLLGFVLFTRGSRHVGATELSVLSQSEAVFGPVWAYALLHEVPAARTLAGGLVVLAAVVGQALLGARQSSR